MRYTTHLDGPKRGSPAMGGREPGQARDRAAISDNFHVPGVLVGGRFFLGFRRSSHSYLCFIFYPLFNLISTESRFRSIIGTKGGNRFASICSRLPHLGGDVLVARSKDPSKHETAGWLFGSETVDSESNQTKNVLSESPDSNDSIKNSSSESTIDEKKSATPNSSPKSVLLDVSPVLLDENKKQSCLQHECEESTDISPPTPVIEQNVAETKKFSITPRADISTAYQVVARRYRPQAFGELIGQETVTRALSNAIETNRVGHAYLFTGARGVGKTSCARIFAKALNCVEGPTIRPCLKCDSCVGISTGEDVDVIEIDCASNRGVDEIRQLRQNAAIAPSRSRYKIYIIDEVHMLTREAFNALLKTLEEPPARVKFIFCTTEPNKIPITILSRCQRFDFNAIKGSSISSRLQQIAELEGAEVEEGVFDVLARRANGSMRDAQSLLEQLLSFSPNYISLADVHNMLGSVDDGKIFELINATVQGDAKRVFELLGTSAALGVDFGILIEQTFGVYRDLMIVGSGCEASELIYSPIARFNEIKQIAEKVGIRRILASLQIIDQTIQRMRYSAQARILVELAFARLCQLDAFQTIESLINQLKNGSIPQASIDSVIPSPQQTSTPLSTENDKKKMTTT